MPYKENEEVYVSKYETVEDVLKYPIKAIPSRGITKATAEHFQVRVSVSEVDGESITAIYFPWKKKGVITGFKKKDLTIPKEKKVKKGEPSHFSHIGEVGSDCDLFGQDVAPTGGKKSFTVEGEMDVLAAWQIITDKNPGTNPGVVGVGGTSWARVQVANNLNFYSNFKQNIFAFDGDECTPEELKKGVKKGKEALEDVGLIMNDIYVAKFSEKDANKMLMEGKGEEAYWALMSKYKPYVPETICFGEDISIEEIMTPLEEGLQIDVFPELMKKLRYLRKKELTIVLAPTKSGKTTVSKEMCYGLLKSGANVGLQFLEEDRKKTIQSLVCLDNNVLLPAFRENPSILTVEQVKKTKQELIDNKRVVLLNASRLNTKTIMDNMKYMAAMGAEYIVLDHLSYVFSGDGGITDERKAIDLILTELASFAHSEANVHLIVVAHVKRKDFQPKTDKQTKEVIYPYWIPVNKEDGRGSGAFEQLCDNLIVIEPEMVSDGKGGKRRGRIRLKVEACREWDDCGVADVQIMDRNTGRMVAAPDEEVEF